MNKCVGCGDYTLRDGLCERCFRIKNYNDYKSINIKEEKVSGIFDSIKSNDIVVLVVDLLNIPSDFDVIRNRIKNDIILVLNKFDLMPTDNEERFIAYFDKYNLNIVKSFCISCKKNYNIDNLYEYLCNFSNKKIYFIGYTNSGKSSLINKLLYNYSNQRTEITTSPIANTTLDSIEIKMNDMTFIDTPGVINKNNSILDNDILRKIAKCNKIKPITYQVIGKQYILIENICQIEVIDNDITIYIPNNIGVKRFYKEKEVITDELKSLDYDINKKSDIVIFGIGFVKINRKGFINIKLKKDINCFIRDNLI